MNDEQKGTAWDSETFVLVRWEWLSLLAAQVLLSIVVLVFIMVATARSGVEIIKTAPLPALFAIPADEKQALENDPATADVTKREGISRVDSDGFSGLRRRGTLWEMR